VDSRTYGTRYQLGTWTLGSLLSYTHAFNNDLNLTSRTDNLDASNNRTFGYDEIHRLRAAAGPWGPGTGCTGGATYTYDRNGNRLCKGETLPVTNYTYFSGTNRLSATTGGEPATYSYDDNGNTTGDGTHTYAYSDADRLESVDSGSTATYTYDGDGRRVIKSVGSSTTYFFYDPTGRLLAEIVPASGSGKDYLYLHDAPIGRVDWSTEQDLGNVLRVAKNSPNVRLDWTPYPAGSNTYVVRRKQVVNPNDKTFEGAVAIATVTDPTRTYDDPVLNDGNDYNYRVARRALSESLYFYHTDHLGTPMAMTGGTASFVWRAEHRPFGGVHSFPVSTVANNLRFPGQYSDPESGLHQNWHREYHAHTGRYLESDPIGLDGGPNLYGYALANPVAAVDPWGLFSYNAPPPRTQPLHGDALALANCMEQCLGTSFVVTGGSECTPDGRHVPGGVRGSRHCTNQAFDIRPTGIDRRMVMCCAARCGAGYAGDEGDHWHLQTVPGRNNSSGLIGSADRTCCVPQSTGGRP
jgi:RHS repeat-associated protein